MKPQVSIIMGIYNCAEYLSEAIDSLFNQTYDNWELILCDDGSVDNSYGIAKQYNEKYPDKIKLLRHTDNVGLNNTLNDCLTVAAGEYIARMDGDDVSLPTRFEKEKKVLDDNPNISIVSCPMIYFDDSGDWGCGKAIEFPRPKDFVKGTPFCHAPCMIRKCALDDVGGYSTDHKTLRVEDYDLWFRLYAKGYLGYNLQEPLYKMRDDHKAFHRRKIKYALNEAYVRYKGYRKLKIPFHNYIYVFRPLVVSLLPKSIYMFFHHGRKQARY